MEDIHYEPLTVGPAKQENATVSVCIPTYNKAKHIREAIDSVLEQTHNNYELIIVDNASTDDTREIIQTEYGDKVRYYRNPANLGYAYNFNRCISLSKHDYLLILPADDTLFPTFLEKTVSSLERYPKAGFAATRFFAMDEDSNLLQMGPSLANESIVAGREFTIPRILDGSIGITLPLFRKKYLETVGGFRSDIYFSDEFIWLQIAFLTHIVYINEPLITWRCGQSSSLVIDAFKDRTFLDRKFYEFEEIYKFWGEGNIFVPRKRAFFRQLLKLNRHVLTSLTFPLNKRRILKYLQIYINNGCLRFFSPLELFTLLIILLSPRCILAFLHQNTKRILRCFDRGSY